MSAVLLARVAEGYALALTGGGSIVLFESARDGLGQFQRSYERSLQLVHRSGGEVRYAHSAGAFPHYSLLDFDRVEEAINTLGLGKPGDRAAVALSPPFAGVLLDPARGGPAWRRGLRPECRGTMRPLQDLFALRGSLRGAHWEDPPPAANSTAPASA